MSADGHINPVDGTQYWQNTQTGKMVDENCENCREMDMYYAEGNNERSFYASSGVRRSKRPFSYSTTETTPSGRKRKTVHSGDMYFFNSSSEAKNFFENMASITDVEWDNTKVDLVWGTQNMVSTVHKEDMSGGLGYLDGWDYTIISSDHSHPRHGRPHEGDADAIGNLRQKNQGATFQVYYPGMGYKQYNQWTGK